MIQNLCVMSKLFKQALNLEELKAKTLKTLHSEKWQEHAFDLLEPSDMSTVETIHSGCGLKISDTQEPLKFPFNKEIVAQWVKQLHRQHQ